MKQTIGLWIGACLTLVVCSGCQQGPSEADIEKALSLELKNGLSVAAVDIQEVTSVTNPVAGSVSTPVTASVTEQADPSWQTRAKVTLRFDEDFYEGVGLIGDIPVVRPFAAAGDTISGSLLVYSSLGTDGALQISIERLQIPPLTGYPASQFGANGFILENSDQHRALQGTAADRR